MTTIGTFSLVIGLLAAAGAGGEQDDTGKKPAPKVPVGKETTYVTGPLDEEGYIDYEAALNERLGKGITPESNACVLLAKAVGPKPQGGAMPPDFFRRLGIEPPPEKGDYFIGLYRYLKEHGKREPGAPVEETYKLELRVIGRPWAAKDYPDVARWLKTNEKPLVLVVEATKRPHYYHPLVSARTEQKSLIGVLLPVVLECRELTAALTARAMLHLGEGRFGEAWQDLLACHRLGRLVARGGTLIEALVGIVIDQIASSAEVVFLAHADLTPEQLRACLRDLRQLPPMPAIADKVDLADRFMFLDSARLVRRHGAWVLDDLSGGPFRRDHPKLDPRVQQVLDAIDWGPVFRNGNRWYDRLTAAMRLKDRAAREREIDRIEEDLKGLEKNFGAKKKNLIRLLRGEGDPGKITGERIGDVLIGLVVPAIGRVQRAADRAEQGQRNLHVAVALAAYRRDQGSYPEKLDVLAPKYLEQIPGDLFSGGALIYRPSGDGYLLYSVGVNGKDEGGRWTDGEPPGDDLRVRMPLPEPRQGKSDDGGPVPPGPTP